MEKVKVYREYGEAFYLREVQTGGKTEIATKFSLAYDGSYLKIKITSEQGEGFDCPYSGENDPIWRGDAVEFFVSPYGDLFRYFELDVAPNGGTFFADIINPDGYSGYSHMIDEHDIQKSIKVENGLWETEMKVPFALLLKEGDEKKVHTLPWLFNVYRIYAAKEEYAAFSPTGGDEENFHVPSAFVAMELVK